MSFGSQKLLSIDFGSHEIKIVEGRYFKSKFTITNAKAFQTKPGLYENGRIVDMDNYVSFVQRCLEDGDFSSKSAVVVVNSTEIPVRELTLPKVELKEIRSILDFQVAEMFADSAGSYDVDFLVLDTFQDEDVEKMLLLVIAVPKEIVVQHLELLNRLNLEPMGFDYQMNALSKYVSTMGSVGGRDVNDMSVLAVDVGDRRTKLAISRSGVLQTARTLNFGVGTMMETAKQLFPEPDEVLLQKLQSMDDISVESSEYTDDARFKNAIRSGFFEFFNNLDNLIRFYNSRSDEHKVGAILLFGKGWKMNGVVKFVSDRFDLPTSNFTSNSLIEYAMDTSLFANALGGLVRMDGDGK